MPIDILMPKLSPTMEEGRIAKWLKEVGSKVNSGDIIAEVETDKATMEVEAPADGIIHLIVEAAGCDVKVGGPICVLKVGDEVVPADYKPKSEAKVEEIIIVEDVVDSKGEHHKVETHHAGGAQSFVKSIMPVANLQDETIELSQNDIIASPLAKSLAKQYGIDINNVKGSGADGRIGKEDVLAYVENPNGGVLFRKADKIVKNAPMRKAIANKLTTAKQTVPHFYLTKEAKMDNLLDFRKQVNSNNEKNKVTVNDLIVLACAKSLAKYPEANAAWAESETVKFSNVDISVAVSIEGGLITPVVKSADKLSLITLSNSIKKLVKSAREGTLKPEQYEGGSFSVSNLGMFGINQFNAIINPPQAAILAVGATNNKVVSVNGTFVEVKVMNLTLSVDHRVIDGVLGAQLLCEIVNFIENPVLLTLN